MTTVWTGAILAKAFADRGATALAGFDDVRDAAAAALAERGMPNERGQEERFRFLNLQPILAKRWRIAPDGDAADASLLARNGIADAGCQLVFVDGLYRPGLSRLAPGISAGAFSDAVPDAVRRHLAVSASRYAENPFACVNAMFFRDGAWLHLPAGTELATPISIVFLASAQSGGAMICPRLLIVADADAKATVVEQYLGPNATYLTNAVTEIAMDARADLRHYRVQAEAPSACHLASTELRQSGAGGRYRGLALNLGAALSRHDLNAVLGASHLDTTLNGLNLLNADQIADTHSRIEHLEPESRSNELYKGVVADRARAIFNGRIYVAQRAQQTNAFQANPNILLSDDAVANSNPELEIYADDVRCTHGATCGDLDTDALFYLRARGFSRDQAEDLLIYAFLTELLDDVDLPALKERFGKTVFAKLSASRPQRLAA